MSETVVVIVSVLVGMIAGAGVLALILHFRDLNRRIAALEGKVCRKPGGQERLTHYQQDRLETLAFKFGSYLARRKAELETEEAHLTYIHRMIGDLLHTGPDGDKPKRWREQ